MPDFGLILAIYGLPIWILSGFVASWLAGELGRGTGWWLIFGVLLGPIAILAVGFAGRAEGAVFKRCIECQELIPTLATTCPVCTTDLIAAEAAERRQQPTPPPRDE